MSAETTLVIHTSVGAIRLQLHQEAAPQTCDHVRKLVHDRTFQGGASFYRSDFVIQFGVHGTKKPRPKLPVNESNQAKTSNMRGTAAFAHWDVPDSGDTEIFINLKTNAHLDTAYGGFCVFASVPPSDADSFQVIDKIADAIPASGKVAILDVTVE